MKHNYIKHVLWCGLVLSFSNLIYYIVMIFVIRSISNSLQELHFTDEDIYSKTNIDAGRIMEYAIYFICFLYVLLALRGKKIHE